MVNSEAAERHRQETEPSSCSHLSMRFRMQPRWRLPDRSADFDFGKTRLTQFSLRCR